MTDTSHYITPDQLRIGLYVHIDLGWMDHPFTFNNFKIKDEGQIAEIRKLGLKQVRYDPLRSDTEPLPVPTAPDAQTPPAAPTTPAGFPARNKFNLPRRIKVWFPGSFQAFFDMDTITEAVKEAGFKVVKHYYINQLSLLPLLTEAFNLSGLLGKLVQKILLKRQQRKYYITCLVVAEK